MRNLEIVSDDHSPGLSMSETITTLDSDGTILFVTRAIEQIFGFECGEMVGLNALDLIPEDARREQSIRFKRFLRGKENTGSLEVDVESNGGTQFRIGISFNRYRLEAST